MEYRNYWCKCLESDKAKLLALGVMLQVLQESEGKHYATAGDFFEVKPDAETPDTYFDAETGLAITPKVPRHDANGNRLYYANLRTTINLRERAEAMAASNPEIAEALAELSRYFVTDELGQTKAPNDPAVVWAV